MNLQKNAGVPRVQVVNKSPPRCLKLFDGRWIHILLTALIYPHVIKAQRFNSGKEVHDNVENWILLQFTSLYTEAIHSLCAGISDKKPMLIICSSTKALLQ